MQPKLFRIRIWNIILERLVLIYGHSPFKAVAQKYSMVDDQHMPIEQCKLVYFDIVGL